MLFLAGPAMAQQDGVQQPQFDDSLQERAAGAMQRLNLRTTPDGRLDACEARLGEPDRQVLRVQTEMMLTALACAATYNQANLIPTYENFLFRHQDLVREAQDRIARELTREGGGERALEDFQSVLANEEAQTLSQRGTGTYCRMRASRWDFTMTADPDQLAYYTADLARRTAAGCQRR